MGNIGWINTENDTYRVVQVHRDRYLARNKEKELEKDPEKREDDEHCHGTAQEKHGAPEIRKGD